MKFNQSPRFGAKHLSIKAWKFILNLIESIHKFSFHTKNPKFHTLIELDPSFFFSSSSSSSSSHLFFSFHDFPPLTNETNLVFKFQILLRPCLAIKNPFLGSYHNCIFVPQLLAIYISSSFYCILASHIFTIGLLSPLWTNYKIVLKFYNFPGLSFSCFVFKSRNSQIMLTKYPKHVEND